MSLSTDGLPAGRSTILPSCLQQVLGRSWERNVFIRLARIVGRALGGRLWERYKVRAKAVGEV